MPEAPHDPQRLIRSAIAQNQSEAELIQGLLREGGVPSMLRRTPGSDVPDFLAAGPRDVLVAASLIDVARDVLPQTQAESLVPTPARAVTASRRALTALLVAVALLAILAWCATELFV
jgi:hypothetical protein